MSVQGPTLLDLAEEIITVEEPSLSLSQPVFIHSASAETSSQHDISVLDASVDDDMGSSLSEVRYGFFSNELSSSSTATPIDHANMEARSAHHPAFLALILLNVWTTVSNLVVLFVMLRTPTLRRRFGVVMLSLSLADLASSVFVMPLAIYYFSNHGGWQINSISCIGWVTVDVFLCTTSICHHASIAIHRYLSIAKPHQMSMITSNTPIIVRLILPSWTVGFFIAMILAVQAFVRHDIVFRDNTCGLQDRLYLVYSSVVSFFIPLSVIIIVSLKSILLLRMHLRTKQESFLKRQDALSTSDEPLAAMADQSPTKQSAKSAKSHPPLALRHSEPILSGISSLVTQIHNIKAPTVEDLVAGPVEDRLAHELAKQAQANSNPKLAMTGKRSGSLNDTISPELDQQLLESAKNAGRRVSRMMAFRTLVQSYLELGSYVYRSYSSRPPSISRGNNSESEGEPESDSAPNDCASGGNSSSALSQQSNTALGERIRTSSLMQMEAIKEEEHPQTFTPAGSSPFRVDGGGSGLTMNSSKRLEISPLKRQSSFVSFCSELFADDCQSLRFDLSTFPKTDYDSAIISVDEITPSMDLLTSVGFTIADIPSPVDEEHPLDLRVVFSRTVPNFQEALAGTSKKAESCLISKVIANRVTKQNAFRKRAYTINFPIRHVFVQQAPLVKMENLSVASPAENRRRASGPLAGLFLARYSAKRTCSLMHSSGADGRSRSYSQTAVVALDSSAQSPRINEQSPNSRHVFKARRILQVSNKFHRQSYYQKHHQQQPTLQQQQQQQQNQAQPTALRVPSPSSDSGVAHSSVSGNNGCCGEECGESRMVADEQQQQLEGMRKMEKRESAILSPRPSRRHLGTGGNADDMAMMDDSPPSNLLVPESAPLFYRCQLPTRHISNQDRDEDSFDDSSPNNDERLSRIALFRALSRSPNISQRSPRSPALALIRKSSSFRDSTETTVSHQQEHPQIVSIREDGSRLVAVLDEDQDFDREKRGSSLTPKSTPRRKRQTPGQAKRAFLQNATFRVRQREKEKQAERVLLFVLFIFVCLWLPFFTTNFLYGVCPGCVYEEVFVAFTWFGWCSSAINPIVYTFFNRDFKRAFVRLICGRVRRNRSALAKMVALTSRVTRHQSIEVSGHGSLSRPGEHQVGGILPDSLIAAPFFAQRHTTSYHLPAVSEAADETSVFYPS